MKKINMLSRIFMIILITLSACQADTTEPQPTDSREAFLGIWTVNESWHKLTYEVEITADPSSSTGVYIANFAGSGSGEYTYAKVSGTNITITPLPQTLNNGWKIESGSGAMQSGTKITWNYVFNDLADTYTATAVYTQK
jgi:hypothetical protein